MEKHQHSKLEALKHLILAAREEGEVGPELRQVVAAHCRDQRADGFPLESIADALGVTTWELVDWTLETMYQRQEEDSGPEKSETPMLVLEVPMTPRFERILAREAARALQKCDSCCWEELKRTLPSEFLTGREES